MSSGHTILLDYVRKMIEEALARLRLPASQIIDDGTGAGGTNINGIAVGGDLRDKLPNPHVKGLQGRGIAADAPEVGQVLTWLETEVWGPADASGGSGSAISAFKARPSSDQSVTTSSVQVSLTLVDVNVGDDFVSGTGAWTPPAGQIVLGGHVRASNTAHTLWCQLMKNGTELGRSKVAFETSALLGTSADVVILDTASGSDEYTMNVYCTTDTFDPELVGTGTYFWGHNLVTGGSSSGTPDPPRPFVYLVDDDGFYLVDADGAYLFEYI